MIHIKVLLIHNYYQQSGGEDKVLEKEFELLRSNGIEVKIYSVHNAHINSKGVLNKAKIALEATWSLTQYKKIKRYLLDTKPDVVHIHNFFPLISPSVFYACAALNIPVVQTLHNYRLICPSATFLRDNKICEDCLNRSIYHSIKNGCYHNSKFQTIPVATMVSFNKLIDTWNKKVNRYIVLTNFAKNKFIKSGISDKKLVVKPNFTDKRNIQKIIEEEYILYVGRVSIEKGLHLLLEAWGNVKDKQNKKLFIIGDGPEKDQLEREYISEDIEFLGRQDEITVLEYMKNAKYLVVPSICYEGFPLTIVEAYSQGTPVICTNIGSLQEVVKPNLTGLHFKYNNALHLARVIDHALRLKEYEKMRENVLQEYNEYYTPEVNYRQLINIYKDVINENKISLRENVGLNNR